MLIMESLPERQEAIETHPEDMNIGGTHLGGGCSIIWTQVMASVILESPAILLALGPNHIH